MKYCHVIKRNIYKTLLIYIFYKRDFSFSSNSLLGVEMKTTLFHAPSQYHRATPLLLFWTYLFWMCTLYRRILQTAPLNCALSIFCPFLLNLALNEVRVKEILLIILFWCLNMSLKKYYSPSRPSGRGSCIQYNSSLIGENSFRPK